MIMRIGNNNMKEGPQQTIFDSMEESTLHNYKLSADELKQELVKFDLTANQLHLKFVRH